MNVKRLAVKLIADPSRVIMLFNELSNLERYQLIVDRFLKLPDEELVALWEETGKGFAHRHRNYEERLLRHLQQLEKRLNKKFELSEAGKLLLGAYVTKEYSLEAAALFNPSIVPHPSQSGLEPGAMRFIMSLRSTGEGHISSLSFRQGVVDAHGNIELEEESPLRSPALRAGQGSQPPGDNYDVYFDENMPLAERVIFPLAPSEVLGIEDVRLVCMQEEGISRYLGTYTAYDGWNIQSKLLETADFLHFKLRAFSGVVVQDKGMAFFPRKIKGQYAVISRQGGESLSIMFSEDHRNWRKKIPLQSPAHAWEFVQMGNCGSPIETPAGWLMLTHGVGPMRKYALGVSLLDLENPSRVIATLKQPLMAPDETEREGYVPNVLYTCGWVKHGDQALIPYAMSDVACSFATIEIKELLAGLGV